MDRFMDYVAALADLLWRRRWLTAGITWAVLALLFYVEVIFPPVEPAISPQIIHLDSKDYPQLRVKIDRPPAAALQNRRGASPPPREVLHIQYMDHGVLKTLYRCACSGYFCVMRRSENKVPITEQGNNVPVKWIKVQELLFLNAKKRTDYCVIYQSELTQKYFGPAGAPLPFESGFVLEAKKFELSQNNRSMIFSDISLAEIPEVGNRLYFMTFLLVAGFILAIEPLRRQIVKS